jgi:multiple sugar transport system substrate-binding protein
MHYELPIYANGGHIADNPDNPSKSVINSPEAVAAMEWIADLYLKYKVMGGTFQTGKTGFQILGHWDVPDYAKQCKFKWDVVGMPKFKKRATLNFGSAFMIPSNSRHPKEAWELVKFYASPEAQRILARGGFGTPALKTIGESDFFLNKRPPENQRAFLKAIGYSIKRPFTAQWDMMEQTITTEYNKMIAGRTSARATCDKLAVELTKIFARDYAKAK